MQIRRKLAALVAPILVVPAVLAASATTANAAITTNCGADNVCWVHEDMGSGYCEADVWQQGANNAYDPGGNFAQVGGYDVQAGYTCNFFFQRNVNNTGWYNVYTFSEPSSGNGWSPNEWNGLGYQARACLQFNWGSSLGAVHCSDPVFI